MKLIKLLFLALIFFVAGFFVGQGYNLPFDSQSQEIQELGQLTDLTVVIEYSSNDVMEVQNLVATNNQSALDLLSNLAKESDIEIEVKDYGNLGSMVEMIGGKRNGEDNSFWQYWVNGEYSQVGATDYKLKSGDLIEWKFTDYQY